MIIALTGPKGSGKDTVGQLICKLYPHYNPQTIAFADPIKDVLCHVFNLNDKSEYDRFKRSTLNVESEIRPGVPTTWRFVNGRHVVREIGMLMRGYDTKQFTNYVQTKINEDPSKLWIITDLRFDEEYLMLKRIGAKVIKILRPQYDYDGHITERGFDDHLVDMVLMNDGDMEYLTMRVETVMRGLMEASV